MLNKIKSLVVQEEGQGMTEYGLLLAVIVVVVVAVLVVFKDELGKLFTKIFKKISDAVDSI